MGVEVAMDRCVRVSVVTSEVSGEAAQGFGRTEDWVVGGAMANLFASDGILLVEELQGREGDSREDILVMQRCRGGVVDGAIDGEVDVLEEEGLGASLGRGRVEVFGGTEEPEEGDNDEVADVAVEGPEFGVTQVEGGVEIADDRDVDRVDSVGGFILVSHGLRKSSE